MFSPDCCLIAQDNEELIRTIRGKASWNTTASANKQRKRFLPMRRFLWHGCASVKLQCVRYWCFTFQSTIQCRIVFFLKKHSVVSAIHLCSHRNEYEYVHLCKIIIIVLDILNTNHICTELWKQHVHNQQQDGAGVKKCFLFYYFTAFYQHEQFLYWLKPLF